MTIIAAVIIALSVVTHGLLVGHAPVAETIRERIVVPRRRGRARPADATPEIPVGL